MIQAPGIFLPARQECAGLSGGQAPARWRLEIARSIARLTALVRSCASLKAVIDARAELASGPLFGTGLAALTLQSDDSPSPEGAAHSSGKSTQPAQVLLPLGKAERRRGITAPEAKPSHRRLPRQPCPTRLPDIPRRETLAFLPDLPRTATLDLLNRLTGSQPLITDKSNRDGSPPAPSFPPRTSRWLDKPVTTPGRPAPDPLHLPEARPQDRNGEHKRQRFTPPVLGDNQCSPAHNLWADQAIRRATKVFHRTLSEGAVPTRPEAGLEETGLAGEWSAHIGGPTVSLELLTTRAGVSHGGDSLGAGHRRHVATGGPAPHDYPSGTKAGTSADPGSVSSSSVPSTATSKPADGSSGVPTSDKENGQSSHETESGDNDNLWSTPSGAGGSRRGEPEPPTPLTIAPPVMVETLPALLPVKSPRKPGPPVASLLAVRGGREEAALTEDDLSMLADKIKRILDDQARRHGICV